MTGAAAGTALALALVGCSSPSAPQIDVNAFLWSPPEERSELCQEIVGDPEAFGDLLGMTLYESHSSDSIPACVYEVGSGGQVLLGFVPDPGGATVVAKHGDFYAAVYLLGPGGDALPLTQAVREDVATWLQERTAGLVDDTDGWVASLAQVDEDFAATEGFDFLTSTPLFDGDPTTMVTPWGAVTVTASDLVPYLAVDEPLRPVAPAEGHELLVLRFSADRPALDGGQPQFEVLIDGESAPDAVAAAVHQVIERSVDSVVVSVTEGADILLVAAPGGDEPQRISLRTGEVHDGGRGERLAGRVASTSSAAVAAPQVSGPDIDGTRDLRIGAPYSHAAEWELSPWTESEGWAPEGKSHLTLTLGPEQTTHAHQLEVADATVEADGAVLDASSFDPEGYRFTFVVPEGVDRFTAQVRAAVDVEVVERGASGWYWPEGRRVDGAWVYDWTVDVNAAR